jgi:hypothetical protein
VSEPPEGMSAEVPNESPTRPQLSKGAATPSRAADAGPGRPAGGAAPPARAPARRGRGNRRLAFIAGGVVVVIIAIVVAVLALGGGDGTKQMANPLEVRQLVATYQCTPGSSSSVKVTAGQEIVQLGRGGCAIVGKQLAKVDRATKIVSKSSGSGCTVTIESTAKYGAIVDKASVATDGNARALVGGGYILDLRALLYPPGKSAKLNVVFQASNPGACDTVANALRRT